MTEASVGLTMITGGLRSSQCNRGTGRGYYMVSVAQLVRAPDCESGGRRFETDLSPKHYGAVAQLVEHHTEDVGCRWFKSIRLRNPNLANRISFGTPVESTKMAYQIAGGP